MTPQERDALLKRLGTDKPTRRETGVFYLTTLILLTLWSPIAAVILTKTIVLMWRWFIEPTLGAMPITTGALYGFTSIFALLTMGITVSVGREPSTDDVKSPIAFVIGKLITSVLLYGTFIGTAFFTGTVLGWLS